MVSAQCALSPGEFRYVRLTADARPATIAIYERVNDAEKQRFALVSLSDPTSGAPIVVRMYPATEAQTESGSYPRDPGPVAGVLGPLPLGLAPAAGHAAFPAGCPIYWLDTEGSPRDYVVSCLFIAAGALCLIVLIRIKAIVRRIAKARAVVPDTDAPAAPRDAANEEKRFGTLPSPHVKVVLFLSACLLTLAGLAAARYLRTPVLYNSRLIALAGLGLAGWAGWLALARYGGVTLCYGGLLFDDARLSPVPFVRWDEIDGVKREAPTTGSTAALTLTLRTISGQTIRLELGSGPEAVRTGASIVSLIRPWLLPRLRARIRAGKGIDFGHLRMTDDSVGWEGSKGFRMYEFVDLEITRIESGYLYFRMLGSTLDDNRCLYQEMENGFLLPLLLLIFMKKLRSQCKVGWQAVDTGFDPFLLPHMLLTGPDAWLAPTKPVFPEELARLGQAMLNLAVAAHQAGDAAKALPMACQALDFFESADNKEHPGVSVALLLAGHLQLELSQAAEAWETFGRAVKLLERLPSTAPQELGRALNGLAVTLWRCREGVLAQEAATRAVGAYDRAPDAAPLDRAIALNTLTGLLHWRGLSDEARPLMERTLATLEEYAAQPGARLPEPQLVAFIKNLSGMVAERAERASRVDLHGRCVQLCCRLMDNENPIIAIALFAHGDSLLDVNDLAGAAAAFEQALARFEAHYGEQHVWIAACLDRLGDVYWRGERKSDALVVWEHCQIMLTALTRDSARTVAA